MVIRRVNPISAAKVGGVLGVLLGLLIGACMSLFIMMAGSVAGAASNESSAPMFGMMFGAGAVIILPIFYGVFMFVMTLIQAALYNLVAKWVGGVEIDAA